MYVIICNCKPQSTNSGPFHEICSVPHLHVWRFICWSRIGGLMYILYFMNMASVGWMHGVEKLDKRLY